MIIVPGTSNIEEGCVPLTKLIHNFQVKRFFLTISFILTIAIGNSVIAGPASVKAVSRAYYSSPIKEFKGATFYQWKKYEQAKVTKVEKTDQQPQQANKPTVEKGEVKVSASAKD